MPIYQAVVLAVVQAVTEFLPISSTAHLALVPWLLKWHDPGLTFDVALHLGTLVAVLVYFWRVWLRLLFAGFGLALPVKPAVEGGVVGTGVLAPPNPAHNSGRAARPPTSAATGVAEASASPIPDEAVADPRLLWLLMLGTIPAGIAGVAFKHYVETTLRSPYVMAASLIVVAGAMAYGERVTRQLRELKDVNLADTALIGCAQALALVPGVSRSGITITVALLRDLRRDTAARFSFLLATPVIAGAAASEGFDLLRQGIPPDMRLPFLLGIAVAALVGYGVIAFFIRYLQTRSLKIFIYYRLVFGFIILTLAIFSSAP